jgi:hypothetical protein
MLLISPGLTARRWLFQVYDVTPFMAEHPGGEDVMLVSTGEHSCLSHLPHAYAFYFGRGGVI